MMRKKLARVGAIAAAALATLPLFATSASASPSVFRDAQNNLYVMNQSPQARVSLTYDGMMRSRDYQANSCSWITLRNSSTSPSTPRPRSLCQCQCL